MGFGQGGSLASVGTGPVEVHSNQFVDNIAGVGSSVFIVSAASVSISNTTFNSEIKSVKQVQFYGAVQEMDCQTPGACDAGHRCIFSADSRFCEPCSQNEWGDGVNCISCPPGTQPSADHSECMPCSMG